MKNIQSFVCFILLILVGLSMSCRRAEETSFEHRSQTKTQSLKLSDEEIKAKFAKSFVEFYEKNEKPSLLNLLYLSQQVPDELKRIHKFQILPLSDSCNVQQFAFVPNVVPEEPVVLYQRNVVLNLAPFCDFKFEVIDEDGATGNFQFPVGIKNGEMFICAMAFEQ